MTFQLLCVWFRKLSYKDKKRCDLGATDMNRLQCVKISASTWVLYSHFTCTDMSMSFYCTSKVLCSRKVDSYSNSSIKQHIGTWSRRGCGNQCEHKKKCMHLSTRIIVCKVVPIIIAFLLSLQTLLKILIIILQFRPFLGWSNIMYFYQSLIVQIH